MWNIQRRCVWENERQTDIDREREKHRENGQKQSDKQLD